MADHWFDALNKALVSDTSRRALVGAAAAIVLGGPPVAEAAKNRKKKRNGNRKRKKGKPNPAPSCSSGACAAVPEWAGNQQEINHCEFICQQCDEDDPRQFCIVWSPRGPVARCCDIEETCCGDRCCGASEYCCDLGEGRESQCVSTAMACCPDDFETGVCDPFTQKCCPGHGCIGRTEDCPDDDCGAQCAERGLACCHGACIDTQVDPDHCGLCDRQCTGFANDCCNGRCVDVETSQLHCGGCGRTCIGGHLQCCDGVCADTRFDREHCGNCQQCPPGHECCHGRCIDPQQLTCCRDNDRGVPFCGVPLTCCTAPPGSNWCC